MTTKNKINRETLRELYCGEGKNLSEIGKIFGLHLSTVQYHMKKWGIPRRSYRYEPDLTPTPTLSYILGILLGDGGVYHLEYTIILRVTKRIFAENFANALRQIGLNPFVWRSERRKGLAPMFHASAKSKVFYNWYASLSWVQIMSIVRKNKKHMLSFIRGFYESEGSCYWYKRYRILSISNLNSGVMKLIQEMLKKLKFRSRLYKYYRAGRYEYTLRICRQCEVTEFLKVLHPCIKNGTSICRSLEPRERKSGGKKNGTNWRRNGNE